MSSNQLFKADGGKPNPTLLERGCVHALEAVQATLDYGGQKYEPDSWKGVEPSRYDSAARRHRIENDKGNLRDAESNLLHMSHEIVCRLFVLQQYIEAHPGLDYTTFNPPPTAHKLPYTGGVATASFVVPEHEEERASGEGMPEAKALDMPQNEWTWPDGVVRSAPYIEPKYRVEPDVGPA